MRFFKSFPQRLSFRSMPEMAKSSYEYVRNFEALDSCLPNTWIVVRLDGRSFHRFSEEHEFSKPNDERALRLMNLCGESVMRECGGGEIVLGYGQSDEYSFVFRRSTNLFRRRASKLMSVAVSLFASSYVFHWTSFFPTTPLRYPPTFDGRVILYPSLQNVRDYLSWRQVDCHINNLHNTCFWALVDSGKTKEEADKELCGTFSRDKNELLFNTFSINYNKIPHIFRKGSVLLWGQDDTCASLDSLANSEVKVETIAQEEIKGSPAEGVKLSQTSPTALDEASPDPEGSRCRNISKKKTKRTLLTLHEDIIGQSFWNQRPHILQ